MKSVKELELNGPHLIRSKCRENTNSFIAFQCLPFTLIINTENNVLWVVFITRLWCSFAILWIFSVDWIESWLVSTVFGVCLLKQTQPHPVPMQITIDRCGVTYDINYQQTLHWPTALCYKALIINKNAISCKNTIFRIPVPFNIGLR